MNRTVGPILTTTPSEIGSFDWNNRFRVQQWEDSPEDVRMQLKENDAQLLTFINKLPRATREWNNPIMRYSIDTRTDGHTTLSVLASAADTYIKVVNSYVLRVGSVLHLPTSGQQWLVTAVDDDFSSAWTNDAGVATCNVTVDRTKLGGPAVAAALGETVLVGAPYMGELSEPREGTTTVPGSPQFNYITMAGLYFVMSRMQLNSAMASNFGTLPKEMENIQFQLNQQMQTSMIFANRTTYYDATEKQVYVGSGLLFQLQKHTLDLGTLGQLATWPNFNDFFEPMFESNLSALKKDFFVGTALFRLILSTARTAGRIELNSDGKTTYFSPDLGSLSFDITTDTGKHISVHEEKYAFAAGMSDWGIVLDSNNLGGGQYKGLGPQWFMNLQSPSEIMKVKHAFFASWAINVFDDSTMGVVRGGTQSIVNR
jgi:hypothetical protein